MDGTGMDASSEVWDNLDIDLLVKVMGHTVFSPFFVFFIPVFYFFQGSPLNSATIIVPSVFCVFITAFWGLKWYSRLYRNQASVLFGPPPVDWGEQVVVITGGASGVGELLANTLAVRNVSVVVLDVKPIVTENYNITYLKCDVTKLEEVQAAAKEIREEIGEPTVLVNNAGVVQGKLILDLTQEDLRQTFDVNVIAHYNTLKTFLPNMIKENSGHIVTVSSVLGMIGACQLSDYSASKAALMSLHESLRYELDKRYNAPGVRTSLINPGFILSPMFSKAAFPTARWWRFLVPPLQPVTVVKAIIATLDNRHSQTINLPFYVNFAFACRAMPSFMRDACQWLSGADDAMKPFSKVTGRREEEGAAPTLTNGTSVHEE